MSDMSALKPLVDTCCTMLGLSPKQQAALVEKKTHYFDPNRGWLDAVVVRPAGRFDGVVQVGSELVKLGWREILTNGPERGSDWIKCSRGGWHPPNSAACSLGGYHPIV